MFKKFIDFVRNYYNTTDFIPLHAPIFKGNEKKYLEECIDSTFVSSVGKFVDKIEKDISEYTKAKYSVACVNGTAALHTALVLSDVQYQDEVITQPLSFIATSNAIAHCGAVPVYVDVDKDTLGMSPEKLEFFFKNHTEYKNNTLVNKVTKRKIKACVPMHTFGLACRIDEIVEICNKYNIPVIEDSAESIGSYYKGKHTGLFGKAGILSFNGNKTITSGGGGMIITDDEVFAKKAKHITTTAKIPHKWEYRHNMVAFNYRMPNLNAALACAQLEQINDFISTKRELASLYESFFKEQDITFIKEPSNSISNYWLNAIILKDRKERDVFLAYTNDNGVMTRPIWVLSNKLEMYKDCFATDLSNSEWLEDRVVNIPSSVRE